MFKGFMSESKQSGPAVIRIFICSSGDMMEEREAAEQVIHEIQERCKEQVCLEAYRWERNVPHFDPRLDWQQNIPLPRDFDIFIGFVYSRIGTKLTVGAYRDLLAKAVRALDGAKKPADSSMAETTSDIEPPTGTQFEIDDAYDSLDTQGRPCVCVAWNKAAEIDYASSRDLRREKSKQRDDAIDYMAGLNNQNKPRIQFTYGEGQLRTNQKRAGGLDEFKGALREWLRKTLVDKFGVTLTWARPAYVGLRAFDQDELPIFFGRRGFVGAAFDLLENSVRQGREDRPPMLLIGGRSGVGKSSFARAGLLGALDHYRLDVRREDAGGLDLRPVKHWFKLLLEPNKLAEPSAPGEKSAEFVAGACVELLAEALEDTEFSNEVSGLTRQIKARPESGGASGAGWFAEVVNAVRRALRRRDETATLFVVLDQMEQLFTLAGLSKPARQLPLALLQKLAEGAKGRVWVCLVLNDAWRDELEPAGLMPFLRGAELLELVSPTAEELREIIEKPARLKGLIFEQDPEKGDLAERIREDLRKLSLHLEAPLPLLETALERLEKKAGSNVLTFDAYEEMRGLSGAIRTHSAEVLDKVDEQLRTAALDRLFFRLLEPNPRREIVGRSAPKGELEADSQVWKLAQALMEPDARLLVGEKGFVRIAHDVLREHFPKLKEFIDRVANLCRDMPNDILKAACWSHQFDTIGEKRNFCTDLFEET